VTAEVADDPPAGGGGLRQRRRDEQDADRDVPADQPGHVEQGDQLGMEQDEQDEPGRRQWLAARGELGRSHP
jgi:hypothetical protein